MGHKRLVLAAVTIAFIVQVANAQDVVTSIVNKMCRSVNIKPLIQCLATYLIIVFRVDHKTF